VEIRLSDGGEGDFRGLLPSMFFNAYPVPVLAYVNKSRLLVASDGYHHQRSIEQKSCMSAGEYRVVNRKRRVTAPWRIVEGVDPLVCYLWHRFSGRSVDWLLAIITEEFWKFSQFLQEYFVTVSWKKRSCERLHCDIQAICNIFLSHCVVYKLTGDEVVEVK